MVTNREYFRRGENTRGILSGPTAGGKTTLRKSLLREWNIFDIDPLRAAVELEAEKKGVAVDEAEIQRIQQEQNDRFRDEGGFIVETTLQSAKALEFAIERNTRERREINLLVVLAETFDEHDDRYRIRSEERGRACTVAQADNAHLGRLRTLGNCGLLVRYTYETNIVRTYSENGVLAEPELLASYERRTISAELRPRTLTRRKNPRNRRPADALSRDRVRWLQRELAAEDRARSVGTRWTARWFAADDARKPG